jgi:hypothetical protein
MPITTVDYCTAAFRISQQARVALGFGSAILSFFASLHGGSTWHVARGQAAHLFFINCKATFYCQLTVKCSL